MSTIAIVLLVLASSTLGGTQGVLGQDIVTGTVTGVEVGLDGSWTQNTSQSGDDGDVDSLVFTYRSGNFVVTAGTKDVDYVVHILPDGSETTDIDVAATYAVRGITYRGSTYGLFSVVVDNAVHTVIAPPEDFASTIRNVRRNITVDGSTVFFGVDEVVLARLLPDGEGTGEPLFRTLLFTRATPAAGDTPNTPESVRATPAGVARSASPETSVQTGQSTYVAPWSGRRVTWSNDWQIGVSNGRLQVSSSLEGYQYDEICLESARQLDGVAVCVSVYQSGAMDNAGVWRDQYAATTARSRFGTPYYYVHVTDSSVTFAEFDVQGEEVVVSQSDVIGGHRITVRVTGSPENVVDVVEQAGLGIQIDERPVLDKIEIDQLRADTGDVIAVLPEYQAERDNYLREMGMVDATHYTSVSMACDVQWNTPLSLGGLSTTRPIKHVDSFETQPATASERFTLVAGGESPDLSPVTVECLQHVESVDEWIPWAEAKQNPVASSDVTLEGAWAYYLVDGSGALSIAIKPLGGPAVVVIIQPGPNGLRATMETMEPGSLVINGVDVFRVFENDGVVGLLP